VIVEIVNLTSRSLTKVADGFDHSRFGPTLPAALIPPFHSDLFTVESGGIATGVEGTVTYTCAARDHAQCPNWPYPIL
jgi:hypothetical protein